VALDSLYWRGVVAQEGDFNSGIVADEPLLPQPPRSEHQPERLASEHEAPRAAGIELQ